MRKHRHQMSPLAVVALCAVLGACNSTGAGVAPLPAAPAGTVSTAPAPSSLGDISGRWTLASLSGGSCGMNFRGPAGAAEGTIAPEGGCPGNFFTSRKWTAEADTLVIRDHRGDVLAKLTSSAPNRLDGQATTGIGVTMTR
jgi:Protease inhibitor Inh